MTRHEARDILALHRPGLDENDAAWLEARAMLERDPALRAWHERHSALQPTMREKMRRLPVPAGLEAAILERGRAARSGRRRPPVAWLAAAAVILTGVILAFWQFQPRTPDRFADFREVMVSTALRKYRMDVKTNSLPAVKQFLGTQAAPAEFVVPDALAQLALTGGGLHRWRGHKVSMVCYDRGDRQMLFLFVIDQTAVRTPPPARPSHAKVNQLMTTSWTTDGRAYLLAGPEDSEMFRRRP